MTGPCYLAAGKAGGSVLHPARSPVWGQDTPARTLHRGGAGAQRGQGTGPGARAELGQGSQCCLESLRPDLAGHHLPLSSSPRAPSRRCAGWRGRGLGSRLLCRGLAPWLALGCSLFAQCPGPSGGHRAVLAPDTHSNTLRPRGEVGKKNLSLHTVLYSQRHQEKLGAERGLPIWGREHGRQLSASEATARPVSRVTSILHGPCLILLSFCV